MAIKQIIIRGTKQVQPIPSAPDEIIELKDSYLVAGATRGVADSHTVNLKENNLIELVFEDDTTWFCSPNTLEEVFLGATAATRSVTGAFEIPMALQGEASERGLVSNVLVKALNIFTKKAVGKEVAKIAADLEKKQLENYSGLYRLDAGFNLQSFTGDATANPYLLFLHGTNSSTKGSFGELMNTEVWKYMQQAYGNNILALQHETLTKSPIQNVLDLVEQLPQNISLHIISHSRGGLVGDTLARFCNSNQSNRGFNANEINYLKKADRANDIDLLNKIKKEIANKKITISKFIRVACPAGGTILASQRLDNFLNITFNLIGFGTGLAANPVYSAFRNLIAAAIDTKNNANVLPGLEAMNPDSPFIKVLNSPATDIVVDNPLSIISGNCKVKPNLKALLIIASKLFYRKDNDLVVNTGSMYQGTKRAGAVQYYFDENTDVDHFHYFKNKATNNAILLSLKSTDNQLVPGFNSLRQGSMAEMERNVILNLDGGQVFTNVVTGTKPIVVLLPGIMGSNLTKTGKLVWINYLKFLAGEITTLDIKTNGVTASSLIKTSYKKLVDYLSPEYDVVTFPFDWRLQLNKSADVFKNKIEELLRYNQPIKIIGHSMGGVLVRDFIVRHPDTWKTLNQSPKFKLLFLGAPLGGSFRIPAVLFGQDAIISKLAKIDIFHTKKDLLKMFCRMPGILSLLPHATDQENDFAKPAVWTKMGEVYEDWPLPLSGDLKEFENYRDKIIREMENLDYSNIIYIAGKDKATPCGYRIDSTPAGKELVILSTAEGDQSVTWETGIPKKMIHNGSVYYVNVTHGGLSNDPSIFKGISEIISSGSTNLLSKTRPSVRAVEKLFRAPQQESFDLTPEGIERSILGLDAQEKEKPQAETAINVSISNGDLHYASYPVLAGHFLGDGILYAEKAINYYLEDALNEKNKLAIYPGEIGSSEIFISNKQDFQGAIIVGLGAPGTLTAYQLTRTVEQSMVRYLLDLNRKHKGEQKTHATGAVGISSLIIGCGYGGLSIESSLRAIIQGVQNANNKIKKLHAETAVCVQHIEFIEQYEDTALNCFYSLTRIRNEEDRTLNITIEEKRIATLLGSKKQLRNEMPSNWWKRLTVTRINKQTASDEIRCLQFSFSTGGAREEQRELYSSAPIVEQLVEDISTNNRWSAQLAKTIFELLIPNDFKEQLKTQSNINWILEKDTASYPWELLQDATADAKPLCVNAGMIRQLVTQDYRPKINAVTKDNALVIGDPDLQGFVNQLPGALEEGKAVNEIFSEHEFNTTVSLNESAPQIIEKFFRDDYKIIHLAGHGIFNNESPERSGMVIGDNVYLSTREICQMSGVPELVFVNCCFLGKTDGAAEELFRSRYKLAANIGTQLIENGVKSVVVAGWAVDDAAALQFTKMFYQSMFEGDSFGDAVLKARKCIYDDHPGTNTWGAYQCYGDPFYKFREKSKAGKPSEPEFIIEEEAEIQLNNLANEIETAKYAGEEVLENLAAISKAVDRAGLRNAPITQREALIYAELGEYDAAIAKFQSLMTMEDASFSIATLEQYCNVRAKKYVADYMRSGKEQKLYLSKITRVADDIRALLQVSPTAERYSLLGSTFKRKAILSSTKPQKIKALSEAAFYYQKANAMRPGNASSYSITNWLEIETILVLSGDRKWKEVAKFGRESYELPSLESVNDQLNELSDKMKTSAGYRMKYWDMVSLANIKLCLTLVNLSSKTKIDWEEVLETYRQTWAKAGSKGKRLAEIEHLELLIDGLRLSNKPGVSSTRKNIEQLKEELSKII